jgi:hypothetical protein
MQGDTGWYREQFWQLIAQIELLHIVVLRNLPTFPTLLIGKQRLSYLANTLYKHLVRVTKQKLLYWVDAGEKEVSCRVILHLEK